MITYDRELIIIIIQAIENKEMLTHTSTFWTMQLFAKSFPFYLDLKLYYFAKERDLCISVPNPSHFI